MYPDRRAKERFGDDGEELHDNLDALDAAGEGDFGSEVVSKESVKKYLRIVGKLDEEDADRMIREHAELIQEGIDNASFTYYIGDQIIDLFNE